MYIVHCTCIRKRYHDAMVIDDISNDHIEHMYYTYTVLTLSIHYSR